MTESAASRIDLPTAWNPADHEAEIYQRWVDAGYFGADPQSGKPPFTIVLPPPNVTGAMHVGHALDHSLMDALTRRRRMQGYEALWLPGMDHAGIATQNVVERELGDDGVSRHDLGREAFVERVWVWKEEYGGKILGQMRRLGDGVDWSRERFTMDPQLSRAVQTMFKRLYDDDLIYRAERIINWCPRCHTALSDIEVEHEEIDGELTSMRYGDADPDGGASIVVATTRPETMLGDTAVAVHPTDERYQHLIGTQLELPLTGRTIQVIADEHVDREFGSGAVKVTPAHDPNDFEIGRRHELPMPTVMDEQGAIIMSGPFEGLDRFEARPAVVAALREQGRVVEQKAHRHAVGHCSRCDTVVEPRLSKQWWVRVGPLAKAAGDAVRDGRTTIHPQELAKRYFEWVDNMHDWTISRQLWWGHRIPVYYGPDGEVVCLGPDDEPPGDGWTQDPDVLDTWFSSGLWPISTLGWPDDTADLRTFYPTSVLVTGYDILFFWVARMMMFGLYAMDGKQPFDHVFLHGLIRDATGKKMSKSKGNAVDPLDWLDRFGADATRFTLARGANPGSDMAIAEEWAAGSRNFGTKLWNASRFALLNGATTAIDVPARETLTDADRWILDRLDALVSDVDTLFERFEFAKLCDALYHFIWDEFCDWYVELAKVQLASGRVDATRAVLGSVLDVVLRLLHPLMPFLTETLWQALNPGGDGEADSLVVASWPVHRGHAADQGAAQRIADVQKLVTEIRRFRSDQGLKPGQRVAARLSGAGFAALSAHEAAVRGLAKFDEPGAGFTVSASLDIGVGAGTVTVELDLSGAVDMAAERKRLEKDLAAARKELEQTTKKLGNPSFVEKAPAEVVDKIRARQQAAEEDIDRIAARLDGMPGA